MKIEEKRKLYRDFARKAAANWQWGYDLSADEKRLFDRHITQGPVLDAGCGVGRAFSYFEERGFDIVGMDSVAEMLERAREQLPLAELVEGELREVGSLFEPDSFGEVICLSNTISGLIEEDERREFCLGVAEILMPQGVFCIDCGIGDKAIAMSVGSEIIEDNTAGGGGFGAVWTETLGGQPVKGYQYYLSQREFTELLTEAGFAYELFPVKQIYDLTMAVCKLRD